jgi:hypothetical protein
VPERGRLLRVVEALPQVTRHATHTTPGENAWKNHGGAFGRDLAILPLAADGSFAVEAPADRFPAPAGLRQRPQRGREPAGLDASSARARPKGASAATNRAMPPRFTTDRYLRPVCPCLSAPSVPRAVPDGPDQFRYRAKIWFKGHTPDEREERQRTVQSINWFGRP